MNLMSEYVIRTFDLCKKFGDRYAVDHVNMEIKKGQIFGFIGRNGAGKSTLIRMLAGLAAPTHGNMEIFSETTASGIIKAREKIGSIVETPAIYPNLTAHDNLEVQRIATGTPGKDCINEVLKLVNLENTGKKTAKKFSLGMKQRLGLASALLNNPELIILDEPANGLDPAGIAEMRETLKRINSEREITILISSHILGELSLLASCYGIIHDGKMIKQLSAEQLADDCKQCLVVTVDSAEKAVQIIESQFKTKDFEVFPQNIVKLYSNLEKSAEINETLVKSGVKVSSLVPTGQDLESYFIGLTGGIKHA